MKTYDIYHKGQIIGYVEAGSELVYNLDGNSSIGRLSPESNNNPTFIADADWHHKEFNGELVLVGLVPVTREYNYLMVQMELK